MRFSLFRKGLPQNALWYILCLVGLSGMRVTLHCRKYFKRATAAFVLVASLIALPNCQAEGDTLVELPVPGLPGATDSGEAASTVDAASRPVGLLELPDWQVDAASLITSLSEEIRKLVNAANQARAEFLRKQELQRVALETLQKQARDLIRARAQALHDTILKQQREVREELRQKVAELKTQLKEHREAIDQAKQETKSRPHPRKDD